MRELHDVIYVTALDDKGAVIAEIGAGASLVDDGSGLNSLLPSSIEVLADVRKAGKTVGSIQMRAEVGGVWHHYLTAFAYSGLLGLVLILVTSILARAHVARVVRPCARWLMSFWISGRDQT
ncbi:hypothetical protein P6U16_21645 (plasmid) [Rhizobium sp. 32-5/1]|uniref:hypothetical protein n=1 Tax=Rhizobium sp. 32-5/1 TaxID=3019602 RepID=UPI00240E2E19|nr:hypothetical protein [Rhizobium sp. 32-5/1]WEZ85682.1 hypothetical protein P6U16_21645 [Rhizobium sp. 32-5/1]